MSKNFRKETQGRDYDNCSSYRSSHRREIREARNFKYSLSIQTYVGGERK